LVLVALPLARARPGGGCSVARGGAGAARPQLAERQ
jgi:hypothetical protein